MSGWSVWSWDAKHSTWLEMAGDLSKREARDSLERKERAAARLMPGARFTMTPTNDPPREAPSGT